MLTLVEINYKKKNTAVHNWPYFLVADVSRNYCR